MFDAVRSEVVSAILDTPQYDEYECTVEVAYEISCGVTDASDRERAEAWAEADAANRAIDILINAAWTYTVLVDVEPEVLCNGCMCSADFSPRIDVLCDPCLDAANDEAAESEARFMAMYPGVL